MGLFLTLGHKTGFDYKNCESKLIWSIKASKPTKYLEQHLMHTGRRD